MDPTATGPESMVQLYEALVRWFSWMAALTGCLMVFVYLCFLWLECSSASRPSATNSRSV